jgi:hypothetical protein
LEPQKPENRNQKTKAAHLGSTFCLMGKILLPKLTFLGKILSITDRILPKGKISLPKRDP